MMPPTWREQACDGYSRVVLFRCSLSMDCLRSLFFSRCCRFSDLKHLTCGQISCWRLEDPERGPAVGSATAELEGAPSPWHCRRSFRRAPGFGRWHWAG